MEKEEKNRVIDHLAKHIAPGAVLMLRSAHGAVFFCTLLLNPVILEALRFSLCSTLLMRLSILLSCLVNTPFLWLNKNKDLLLLSYYQISVLIRFKSSMPSQSWQHHH
ncbi:hypothetical protein PIB30_078543 [Stylosanthes scabra]|uniref:Nicotianamine synthase n=1 Tax=Stylosanthes scabra TaxID=79078 RepID=A0ABU6RRA8_9FABA|nr:hypothetical protein [Stylosanthes scabra]